MSSTNEGIEEVLALLKRMDKELFDKSGQHENEHVFIRQLIEESKARKEFWTSIQKRVVSGTLWTVIVAVATGFLYALKQWLSGNFMF